MASSAPIVPTDGSGRTGRTVRPGTPVGRSRASTGRGSQLASAPALGSWLDSRQTQRLAKGALIGDAAASSRRTRSGPSVPVGERGYPHPDLLAETDWLASRLSDPAVRVIDARSGAAYAGGHLPGAVHLDGYTFGGLRTGSEMPEPEAFARLVGALGIDERTTVVAYDAGDPPTAGMVAWAFLYYGHSDSRLLDGGLKKWTAEGLPLSDDDPAHQPRAFAARLVAGVHCSLDQAKASVDDDGVVFWDVRSVGEFEGTTKGWNAPPRLGHLPGAVHLDWAELFDADNGTLKPAAQLTTLLGAKGITPDATVAAY